MRRLRYLAQKPAVTVPAPTPTPTTNELLTEGSDPLTTEAGSTLEVE